MPAFSKGSPRLIRGPMHLHNSLSVYRLPIHLPVPSSLSLSLENSFPGEGFFHFFSFFLSFPFVEPRHVPGLTSEENGARKRAIYFAERKGKERKGGTRVNWTSRKLAITKGRKWGVDDWREFRVNSNDFDDSYIIWLERMN